VNLVLLAFAALHIGLLSWSFRWGDNTSARLWLLRTMLFGMFWDNLMQGLGNWFIDASWYESANILRFVLHAGVLPFLLFFTLSIMQSAGIAFAHSLGARLLFPLLTAGALAYGLYHEVYLLELGPKPALGVQKLGSLSGLPPIATIATNIIMLPLAAWVWRASGWPWFFLGALFIFLLNGATGSQSWGFIAGNFGEVVFIVSLLLTEKHFRAKQNV
jgi:hypothetical protein